MISAILAIDQAEISGVALGSLLDHAQLSRAIICTVKGAPERSDVARAAIELCAGDVSSLAVVFEDHGGFKFSRGNMSVRSVMGMGAARGRWLEALELVGVKTSRIYRVSPETWRGAVLGLSKRVKADVAKAKAVEWARAVTGMVEVQTDAAEALAILHWAARNLPAQIEASKAAAAIARKRAKGAA